MDVTRETTAPKEDREEAVMTVRHAAVWAMVGQYLSFAILFISSVVISRYFLSPDEVGLFSIAFSAAWLVSIIQDFGLSRYIASLRSISPYDITQCSCFAVMCSFIVAGIIAAIAVPMADFYHQPDLTPLLWVIAASYLFTPFAVVPMALMGRAMQFRGHFIVNVGGAFAQASVAIVFAYWGYSAFSLAWAAVANTLIRGALAQILRPAMPWPLQLRGAKKVLNYGVRSSVLYMIWAFGQRTQDMIVGKILGPLAVGFFSRAFTLSSQFCMLIVGAIGSVFFPAFARMRDRGEPFSPAYLRVVGGFSAIVWPCMLGLSLLSQPLVLLLYGPAWADTAAPLAIIGLAQIITCALPLAAEIPILLNHMNRLTVYSAIDATVSISLLIIGSHWGVEGAAISRLVHAAFWYVLYFNLMRTLVGFQVAELLALYAKSALCTVAAVLPLCVAYLFWVSPSEISISIAGACIAVGGTLWFLTLLFLRHPAIGDMVEMLENLPLGHHARRLLGRFI